MKKMLMVTGLPVWSIGKGVGAPSFYKTIELYNNNGWSVDLWTTERKIDITEFKNVNVSFLPIVFPIFKLPFIYSLLRNTRFIINQILIIFKFIIKSKQYDCLYGYEVEFIPGLHFISKLYKIPLVTRFQGTILQPLMKKKLWKFRYLPHSWSLSINSTLTIMTDDGTFGDEILKVLRKNLSYNIWFVKNGVDNFNVDVKNIKPELIKLIENNEKRTLFFSVSRLQSWKRVDRSLEIFKEVLNKQPNSFYIIGGDGEKKDEWEKYSIELGIADKVAFVGGINKDEVYFLHQKAKIFLSTYELSNMGNPLFEAMSNGCVVATLSNGTTSQLIQDFVNGIISDEQNYIENGAKICKLLNNNYLFHNVMESSLNTIKYQFQTWDKRMAAELKIVEEVTC